MMSQLIIDIFFAAIFLLLLVMLHKIKERAFDNNRDSYRYTYFGISILGCVSILQLLVHQNLFESVPLLSEPVYLELALGIGIVAGITFMIAGVSIWLPVKSRLSRIDKNDTANPGGLDIEKAIIQSENIRNYLKRLPQIICSKYDFESYVSFYMNNRTKKFQLTTHSDLPDEYLEQIRSFDLPSGDITKQPGLIKTKVDHSYCMTIAADGQVQILILFKLKESSQLSHTDRITLDGIGRLISNRLNFDYLTLKEKFYSECWTYYGYMKNILARKNSIGANLGALHKLFKSALGSEYFSLAIIGRKKSNPQVYTVGISGNILLDGGNSSIANNELFRKVMETRRPVLINNINDNSEAGPDSMFISCGQCSLISMPIISDGQVIAVLTLGHSAASQFSKKTILKADVLGYAMVPAIESEIQQSKLYDRDRSLVAINGFEQAVKDSMTVEELLQSSAELLAQNIGTTMIRLSILDGMRTKLKTVALKLCRPVPEVHTGDTFISDELTRWHKVVAEEGRLLLINQNDDESCMDKSELERLVFKNARSALIVPIIINGQTFGMITLGEMREWNRFSYNATTIGFCKAIAAKMADNIKLMRLSLAMASSRNRFMTEPIDEPEDPVLERIKTPLAGDRGSVNRLKPRIEQYTLETTGTLNQ